MSNAAAYAAAIERLRAEGDILERIVADLPAERWSEPTPAKGWTVAHQIAHLTWTDIATLAALEGESAFDQHRKAAQDNPDEFVDDAASLGAQQDPCELFTWWQTNRHNLANALEHADQTQRFPWFGPSMKARSLITARIMETWAHGQDVATALGASWPQTEALKDVAHIGIATRSFTYQNNNLEPPTSAMYVELTAPDGSTWQWGVPEAVNVVTGSAWDFALLVTQRAELNELNLSITGDDAQTWATIAQAFAGPPKSIVRARLSRH